MAFAHRRRGSSLLATALGIAAILLWAGLALTTVGARGVPPLELLCLSFGVAFLAGFAVLAARGRIALRQLRQPPVPWLCAFCAIFFYHALYFFALSAAPPAQASLIAYLWPLLIVLLSAAAPGGERLRANHFGGALLGLTGTALILLTGHAGGIRAGAWAGYAAAVGCAFIWSGYSVLNRRFAGVSSFMLVGVCGAVSVAGGLCHLALAEPTVWPDGRQWIAILILGAGPTGLAFLAWDYATKHGRLPVLGALSYLAPLISTVLLVAAGRTAATGPLLAASLLIIGGALLAAGLPRRRTVAA